jgi:hypothetical protein
MASIPFRRSSQHAARDADASPQAPGGDASVLADVVSQVDHLRGELARWMPSLDRLRVDVQDITRADLHGTVTALSRQLSALSERVEKLSRTTDRHDAALATSGKDLRSLGVDMSVLRHNQEQHGHRLEHLEHLLDEQQGILDEQQAILDKLRAQIVRLRPDLADEDVRRHHDLAADYEYLVVQALPSLVRLRHRLDPPPPGTDRVVLKARLVVRLWEAAFEGPGPVSPALLAVVLPDRTTAGPAAGEAGARREPGLLEPGDADAVHEVVSAVESFRDSLVQSSHSVTFPRDVAVGEPADPDAVQLWPPSEPGEPIDFVVAPGYAVADRTLRLPWVMTRR